MKKQNNLKTWHSINLISDRYFLNQEKKYNYNTIEKFIRASNKICDHQFDFLGINNKYFGENIAWHEDIKSGHIWNFKFYNSYSEKELMPGNGIEIKIPWELNRLHHFVTLAQTWRLTKNAKYSDELFSEWIDWSSSNPFGYGINWTSTIEVSIRSLNLLVAMDLMTDAKGWSKIEKSLINSIREHGHFIENNIEIGLLKNNLIYGNHYLSNICALSILGMVCKDFPESNRWLRAGIKALENAMDEMVLDDGFYFESSTSYHRFALELFLYPYIVGKKHGFNFSTKYKNKLIKMFEIIKYLTTPGGTIPQIGDNDDGRLFIFHDYPNWERNDFRYLLEIGYWVFSNNKLDLNDYNNSEINYWLFGNNYSNKKISDTLNVPKLESISFVDSGIYIIRNDIKGDYALIKLGSPNSNAPKAHSHNDILSIELWSSGKPIFIDPGTYCYTSNKINREYFRSNKNHNTVTINEQEYNNLSDSIFNINWITKSSIKKWQVNKNSIKFIGKNDLMNDVYIERIIEYIFSNQSYIITDNVIGHLNKNVKITSNWLLHDSLILNSNNDENKLYNDTIELKFSNIQKYEIIDSHYSPRYGVMKKTSSIISRFSRSKEGKYFSKLIVSKI